MSEEPTKAPEIDVSETNDQNNTNTATKTPLSRYGSSMGSYGGLSGGLGGMGGLGSMGGMGSMGYGMGGMGGMGGGFGRGLGNRQNNQREYYSFFYGIQALLQIIYSGVGFFMFSKIFAKMMVKMIKFVGSKLSYGIRWITSYIILNKIATRILDGIFRSFKNNSPTQFYLSLFTKGLCIFALICISVLWFLSKGADAEREQEEIMQKLKSRRRKRLDQIREANEKVWGVLARSNNEEVSKRENILEEAWLEEEDSRLNSENNSEVIGSKEDKNSKLFGKKKDLNSSESELKEKENKNISEGKIFVLIF